MRVGLVEFSPGYWGFLLVDNMRIFSPELFAYCAQDVNTATMMVAIVAAMSAIVLGFVVLLFPESVQFGIVLTLWLFCLLSFVIFGVAHVLAQCPEVILA